MKISEIVNKKFDIKLGSSTHTKVWDLESLTQKIENILLHNLYDGDFSFNWTDNSTEYRYVFKTITLQPMMDNINETLDKYFELKYISNYPTLCFKPDSKSNRKFIDDWFVNNKNISTELQNEYYIYRLKYTGVTL
jgi:hypothetical protein